jgi:uncharacterized protein (DUF433 family)
MSTHAASPLLSNADFERFFEPDPAKPGRHNVRFVEHGHHVWAIIGYLRASDWDVAETARAWNMSEETVRAAIQYYERHRALFDAYFLLEEEAENDLDRR